MNTITKIEGLKALIKLLKNTVSETVGIKHITLLSGTMSLRYGTFVVKNETGVIHEHCGLKYVGEYIEEGYLEEGDEVKFMGVRIDQQEACEFNVEFKEKEVIESSIKMKTLAGGGSRKRIESNTPVVVINTETKQEAMARGERMRLEALAESTSTDETDSGNTILDELKELEIPDDSGYTAPLFDRVHADTLTKAELAEYALTFGITLNTSDSRANMDAQLDLSL